jgi:hypothetical protein
MSLKYTELYVYLLFGMTVKIGSLALGKDINRGRKFLSAFSLHSHHCEDLKSNTEQGVEVNIWTLEKGSNRNLEETA